MKLYLTLMSDEKFVQKYGTRLFYWSPIDESTKFNDQGDIAMKKPCSKNKIIPVHVTRENQTSDFTISQTDVDEVVWYNPRKFTGHYPKQGSIHGAPLWHPHLF